jgi:hypothetical protein
MAEFKRSRLSRKSEEQITKKTVLVGLMTALLFVVVLVFGLPLLFRFSLFLGNIRSKVVIEDTLKVIPPSSPRMIIPYEATNSALIKISGYAENETEVELLLNGVSYNKEEVDENGSFVFEEIELTEGENYIQAVTISKDNISSDISSTFSVNYDKTSPYLDITNPDEDSVEVESLDYEIRGETESGSSVTIDNNIAVVDDMGQFKLKIQLISGENEVEITSRDLAGNETSEKIKIKYAL